MHYNLSLVLLNIISLFHLKNTINLSLKQTSVLKIANKVAQTEFKNKLSKIEIKNLLKGV